MFLGTQQDLQMQQTLPPYVSSIPTGAREKVTARGKDRSPVRAEYYLGETLVGIRLWNPDGTPSAEYAYEDNLRDGWTYFWNSYGRLQSAQPYEKGLPHGTAYQWASDGRLLGTYTMESGNGLDLWWREDEAGRVRLQEVHPFVGGQLQGFAWQFAWGGQLAVEQHWFAGKLHGIERRWSPTGKLLRGNPRYWIDGQRVRKPTYVKAATQDTTLPPLRPEDDLPERDFPPEVARVI